MVSYSGVLDSTTTVPRATTTTTVCSPVATHVTLIGLHPSMEKAESKRRCASDGGSVHICGSPGYPIDRENRDTHSLSEDMWASRGITAGRACTE